MSGRVLLDTNIVIAIFAEELPVLERIAAAEEVFVPAVALGELYYGARKSERAETNIARIDEFAAAAAILGCDALTAQQYGRIKNDLRAKGRPIPENDIWIGAVGMQHDLTVATRDHDHFSQIPGLTVEVW
jgi:tRNA(fMet)-specific endonuclease VapC